MKKRTLVVALLVFFTFHIQARIVENVDFEVQYGINMGGFMPSLFDMPLEIEEIQHVAPVGWGNLQMHATYFFNNQYGIQTGLAIENRGMTTDALVKSFHTKVVKDNSSVEGYFTGKVHTHAQVGQLTLPVSFVWHPYKKWNIEAGFSASYIFRKTFEGAVSDGYLRHLTPIGSKIAFEGSVKGEYDFSEDMRDFNVGFRINLAYLLSDHYSVKLGMHSDFLPLFEYDFKTISYKLHPIFMHVALAYRF